MVYPTIDQWGIFINMIAGAMMGIDLFLRNSQIKSVNEWLEINISNIFQCVHKNIRFLRPITLIVILFCVSYLNAYDQPFTIFFIGPIPTSSSMGPILKAFFIIIGISFSFIIASKLEATYERFYSRLEVEILKLLKKAFNLLTLSPKGVLGSIGIIFFILGNALQLWATFQ